MRTAPALAVAAVLVLAGCGALGGPSPTATRTPTPTGTPDAGAVPGVSDGRLADPGALLSAHEAALVETGFESDFRVNATERFRGEVYDASSRQRTLVEPGADEYAFRTTRATGVRFDTWGNRSVSVTRGQAGETVRYQVGGSTGTEVLTNRAGLRSFLTATGFEVRGVEARSNRTLVTLVSTGTPDPVSSPGVVPENATDLREYEVRVVVDTDGRVLSFRATAEYTIDGEEGSMTVTYGVIRLDRPAVDRPDWVAETLREAGETSTPTG
jgi:hypothetical protein